MTLPTHIAILILALSILVAGHMGRFEIDVFGKVVYRIDRLTGKVEGCEAGYAVAYDETSLLNKSRPSWCQPFIHLVF